MILHSVLSYIVLFCNAAGASVMVKVCASHFVKLVTNCPVLVIKVSASLRFIYFICLYLVLDRFQFLKAFYVSEKFTCISHSH